jgi:hypothetical protein
MNHEMEKNRFRYERSNALSTKLERVFDTSTKSEYLMDFIVDNPLTLQVGKNSLFRGPITRVLCT